ncbi:ribosome biogenesis GTPase YqeH [Paenibacillus sp. CC-CFT747]|nr:ribosome biogenesis GTPase YqeH [Paenibacillus sp. CC-CFT747]
MSRDTEHKHCEGCGVELQTEEPSRLGYIPPQALEKTPVVCQRCYRIKHYNEMSSIALQQDDFLKILGEIGHTRSLVLHIVDLFDFEGTLISGLQRFIGTNPVLLVVNKIDLLPKVTNLNKLLNWVQKQAKENGLKVADIVLVSAKKNIGFDRLLEKLDQHRDGRNVYVVGATNVGKSTLINRLIRDYSDLEAELTVSQYPGTTLNLVHIPIDDGSDIIDTPGIVYKHRLTELVERRDLNALLPGKPVNPMIYQLNERQTLYFGSLARFDFVKGPRQSFTCYVSNSINIHRTKLEKADELYEEHKGKLLQPPAEQDLDKLPTLTKHPIHVRKGRRVDVLISGLGWVKLNSEEGAELEVHVPRGVKVAVRDSLI